MNDDTTGEVLARKYLAEYLSRGVRFALAAKMALNRASAEGADVLTMRAIEDVSGGTCYRRGTRIHIKRERQ